MKKLILALLLTGTALAQQTINGVANQSVTGTSGSVSYSNYGGVNTFGDSITQGTGAGTINTFMQQGINALSYANMLISDFGGNGQNYGYGGDQAADMSVKVYANANPAVSNNPITTMLIGTNDVIVYGANTDKQNIFLRSLDGSIGWAAIPDAYKVYTKDTNFCTRTGTWATDSGAERGGAIYSTTNASALTCSISVPTGGSAIYYGYVACDSWSPGAAAILIDGSAPSSDATVISYGQNGALISTSNGAVCGDFLARYPVSTGAHTFKITVSSASGIVEPRWLGTPFIDTTSQAPPLVLVGGVPWNQGDSPSTTTAAYNTIVSNAVSTLHGDGTPVYFVDIRNGTNTRNSNTATPLNSTTDYSGGAQGDVSCPASWNLPYHPNSAPYWSRSCGHGHLAGNFEAAIGVKSGGPQGSQSVAGGTLSPNGYAGVYGYGFSANGDLRRGSMAGWYYDSNMHWVTPLTSACHNFEQGNSPAGGTPTITSLATFCNTMATFNTAVTFNGNFTLTGIGSSQNNTISFGANFGKDAIDLYAASSDKYYWGLNAGEMQFGVQDNTTTHFSFNAAAGGLQTSGTAEYGRLTPRTSGGGWTVGSGMGYCFATSTTSTATADTCLWKSAAGVMNLGNATAGNAGGTLNVATVAASTLIKTASYTVAGLPSASTSGAGAIVRVSDASSFTAGTCTGGGSNTMLAVSDGTSWTCH